LKEVDIMPVKTLLSALVVMCTVCHGTEITLDFDFLPSDQEPSDQKWTYLDSPVAEQDVYSVDGEVLTLDTIGLWLPQGYSPGASYGIRDIVNTDDFALAVTARCLQEEIHTFWTPQTFHLSVVVNGQHWNMVLGTNQISLVNGGGWPTIYDFADYGLEGNEFHEYVLRGAPGAEPYTVTVDDAVVFFGTAANVSDNGIFFGDGSGTGNVHVEIMDLTFRQPANSAPVANAGDYQRVVAGDTVYLDGSGSSDPDDDPLSFNWAFDEVPEGSLAEIVDPSAEQTSFVADVAGTYIVRLVVNDGTIDSEPATVTITAIPPEEAAIETLILLQEVIDALPTGSLKNKNSGNALINKIEAALAMIAEGRYEEALDKLENDILKKTDGCAETGTPDNNDWIVTCDEQEEVYPLVLRTIELLARLIP